MKNIIITFIALFLCSFSLAKDAFNENSTFSDLKIGAEKGDASAQYWIGIKYERGEDDADKNSEKAFEYYKKSAEQGYTPAQLRLGVMYAVGKGIAKDPKQAVFWFQKAAEQGDAQAQYFLGSRYYSGTGVGKDMRQAIYWYQKAADQGNADAQLDLGEMYANGEGVAQNTKQAIYWYQKAIMQGDKIVKINAEVRLAIIRSNTTNDNITNNPEQDVFILKLLQEQANQGNVDSQYGLAMKYYYGNGVTKDMKQAAYWYQKAADQGNVKTQYYLGLMYYNGEGVAKDPKQAAYWCQKAAEAGDVYAQYFLGSLYYDGDGVTRDLRQAAYWYQKAAEGGESYAQSSLGSMYYDGVGVTKDPKQAIYWYQKAAEQGNAGAQLNLGYMYAQGIGVLKDEIEGLAWYYLARSNGEDTITPKNIDIVEGLVGQRGALAAQQRAREIAARIKTKSSNANSQNPNAAANGAASLEVLGTGSGVIISADGLVLTAAHVIEGSKAIKISTQQGLLDATVVQVDATNDVALLRCKGQFGALRVVNSKSIRLGQGVFTIGFPQTDVQGFSPKLTKGEISSLAGMRDDPRHWQISAPIQPGNSGGPLFDANGDIIGIIVSKLDEIAVAERTGNLTQNVNYALKSAYIRPLLEEQNITIGDPKDGQGQSARLEDVAERVQKSVVMVISYGER